MSLFDLGCAFSRGDEDKTGGGTDGGAPVVVAKVTISEAMPYTLGELSVVGVGSEGLRVGVVFELPDGVVSYVVCFNYHSDIQSDESISRCRARIYDIYPACEKPSFNEIARFAAYQEPARDNYWAIAINEERAFVGCDSYSIFWDYVKRTFSAGACVMQDFRQVSWNKRNPILHTMGSFVIDLLHGRPAHIV